MTGTALSDVDSYPDTILSDRARLELRLDPTIGAGNYLHAACRANKVRDVPVLFSDRPIRTAWTEPVDRLSLDGLKEVVDSCAAWYLARGVERFDPVAVYLNEGVEYLIHYTALTGIGAIPVVVNGAMAAEVAADHLVRMGTVGVYTDTDHESALRAALGADAPLRFLATDESAGADEAAELPDWYPFEHQDDDPVMITHTSGTTGVPKGVLLRHGGFFHGIRHLLGLPAAKGTDRFLSSLPSSHNSAIAYAMHALLNGFQMMISSDRGGEYVLGTIERFRPGTVISFPHTYVEMTESEMDSFDLESVNIWLSSGDASHQPHIQRLVRYGHHYRGDIRVEGSQFVDGLGSSEMGHTLFRVAHTTRTNAYDRCVGMPQSWIEAVVLDEGGREKAPFEIGLLGVRGPSVTAGYWNDSVRTYRSRLRGYWLTGDLAYADENGYFYEVDRAVDAITTGEGVLYSLQTEELLLKTFPEIADCTVVGVGTADEQEPVCLVRLKPGAEPEPADLLRRCNEALTGPARPRLGLLAFVTRADIPVGVTGKVLKAELRRRYPDPAAVRDRFGERVAVAARTGPE